MLDRDAISRKQPVFTYCKHVQSYHLALRCDPSFRATVEYICTWHTREGTLTCSLGAALSPCQSFPIPRSSFPDDIPRKEGPLTSQSSYECPPFRLCVMKRRAVSLSTHKVVVGQTKTKSVVLTFTIRDTAKDLLLETRLEILLKQRVRHARHECFYRHE